MGARRREGPIPFEGLVPGDRVRLEDGRVVTIVEVLPQGFLTPRVQYRADVGRGWLMLLWPGQCSEHVEEVR